MRLLGLTLLLACWSDAAQARWLEAASDHFVVYADTREATLREFAEELELYHSAVERVSGRSSEVPSPSNRITIYVVGDMREIRRLSRHENRFVAGFYMPRASGSIAFVPRISTRGSTMDISQIVLLHEYAHHLLISSGNHVMPRWLSEGAAEFYASAKFRTDSSVLIGTAAQHRAGELFNAAKVSVERLLDDNLYQEGRGRSYDAYYGRAWLLYHYLIFSEARQGQLSSYWAKVTSGTPSLQAGREAVGDLSVLEDDLDDYLTGRRINQLEVTDLAGSPINIRPLSAGEATVMPLRMVSKRGVSREEALELLPQIRAVAARFPGDAAVQAALAEAEYDSGNDAEAIAAADAALAADPTQVNAYVQKGYALFRHADKGDHRATAYSAGMAPFQALNRLENDHPLPLIYLYRSYRERGEEPSELAIQALERALELAPYDQDLRMMAALQQASDGRLELARLTLQPVAFAPHGGGRSIAAGRLLTYLADWEDGTIIGMDPLMTAMRAPTAAETAIAVADPSDTPTED
jgi:tetratricopeptide (TPR) repeat protein